ncbi:MAG: Ig-like domain-containing protein, partial [bacterium]
GSASDTIEYDQTSPLVYATLTGNSINPATYTRTHLATYTLSFSEDTHLLNISEDGSTFGNDIALTGTETEATYTFTLGDGKRYLYFKFTDASGRTSVATDWLILDTGSPTGSIVVDPYTNQQTITLTLTYHDETSGIYKVRYSTDTTNWTDWETPQAIRTYSLCTTTSNTYIVYYQIIDKSSNTATFQDTIILDLTKPMIELFTQKPYGSSTQIIIEGTATDEIATIDRVEYAMDNVWYFATPKDGSFDSKIEAFTFILINLPDGTQTITARAIDQAGNYGTESNLTFHIDSIGPEITRILIIPPITNKSPLLIATATDRFNGVTGMDYWIDTFFGTPTGTITTINGIGTATIDIANLAEGSHIVYLRAYDFLGNAGDTKQTLFTVITSEAVAIITPGTGTHIKGIVEVSAIAPDSTRKVVFEYGSLTCTDSDQADGWSVYWKTPQDEAIYTICASAYNISNQFLGSNTVVVEVDNILPIGTLTITPQIASRTATIELVASGDVISVLFEYGSGTAYDRNLPFSFMLDVSNLPEGTWTIFALMEDEVGNKAIITESFRVDNTPPSAEITKIDGGVPAIKTLKGTVIIEFSASDTTTAILGTPTVIIDGVVEESASCWNKGTGTYIWDTAQYPNGGHSLKIKAQDLAGNCGYSPLVAVNVNNTQPPVIIYTPQDEAIVSGTVSVSLSSAPDWTHYVAFRVTQDFLTYYGLDGNGTRTIDYRENGWRADWLTTAFPDGDWVILAEAYSSNHQLIGTDSVRVSVDNTPPAIKILSPTSLSPVRTYADRRLDIQYSYTEAHPSFLEIELLDGTITLIRKIIGGLIPGQTTLYESIFVPQAVPDGSYTLQVRLGDVVGHQATDTQRYAVIIETTPPDVEKEGTLTFTPNLINGEIFYSNALLRGTASSGIARVRIECNDVSQGDITFDTKREFRFILSLREGTNTVDIYFTDISGNTGSLTKTIIYRVPKIVQMVGVRGGVIINPNGSRIEMLEGALIGEKRVSFNLIMTKDEEIVGSLDNSILFLKTYHMLSANSMLIYEFTADGGGYVFHQPVKVVLTYDDSNWDKDLDGVRDADELDEGKLEAFYYDEVERVWIKVGGAVDPVNNTITFWVNHISIFALGVETKPSEITDLKVYLTRNPFKLSQDTSFVFALPKPCKVYLRIFDLAGDLVREVLAGQHYTSGSSVNWNGWNDVSDKYVGSGIYIYQFRVEYDDGKTEQIVKPVGVVK